MTDVLATAEVTRARQRALRIGVTTLLIYAAFLAYQSLAGGGGWSCDERALGMGLHISRTDMLANVVAYFPLGFVFVFVTQRPGQRSPLRTVAIVVAGVALAAALSACLEIVQACLPERVSSLYDVGGNVAGALLGLLFGFGVRSMASPRHEVASGRDAYRPLRMLTMAVVVGWVASQTLPWVFTLDVGTVWANVKSLRVVFQVPPNAWHAIRYATAWLAVACAWRLAMMKRHRALAGLVITVAATVGLQLLLPSPAPISAAELSGAAAALVIALPAITVSGEQPDTARWGTALMVAATASIIVYELLPGPDMSVPASFSWWPLVGLGSMLGAIDYAILFAWFGVSSVIAGAWAIRVGNLQPLQRWPIVAVVLTLALEALQTQIPGRSGDVSAPLMTLLTVLAARAFLRSTIKP